MRGIEETFDISKDLLSLTEREVSLLDQEVSNGEGWTSYSRGQIVKPTVFKNKLSGLFYEHFREFNVEIQVNGAEISTRCTCGKNSPICKHVVALLYCWINDQDGFTNISYSLNEFRKKNKEELLEVLTRIFVKNPQNIFLVGGVDPLDDDIDDTDGMFN